MNCRNFWTCKNLWTQNFFKAMSYRWKPNIKKKGTVFREYIYRNDREAFDFRTSYRPFNLIDNVATVRWRYVTCCWRQSVEKDRNNYLNYQWHYFCYINTESSSRPTTNHWTTIKQTTSSDDHSANLQNSAWKWNMSCSRQCCSWWEYQLSDSL